jgi:hypothetical protein
MNSVNQGFLKCGLTSTRMFHLVSVLADFHVFDLFGDLKPTAPKTFEFPENVLGITACMYFHLGVKFHRCPTNSVDTIFSHHIHT